MADRGLHLGARWPSCGGVGALGLGPGSLGAAPDRTPHACLGRDRLYGCGTSGCARRPQHRHRSAGGHHRSGGRRPLRVMVPRGPARPGCGHPAPSWIRAHARGGGVVVFHATLVLHDFGVRVRVRAQRPHGGCSDGSGPDRGRGRGSLRRVDGRSPGHGAYGGVDADDHGPFPGIEHPHPDRFAVVVAGPGHVSVQLRVGRRGGADDQRLDG